MKTIGRRLIKTSSDEDIGQCFGFRKGQTHRKVATQSLRSKGLRLYDSGTAVIQSFHRTASASVVRVQRQRVGGEQVMLRYDSKAVSPHTCRASRGCERDAATAAAAAPTGLICREACAPLT